MSPTARRDVLVVFCSINESLERAEGEVTRGYCTIMKEIRFFGQTNTLDFGFLFKSKLEFALA